MYRGTLDLSVWALLISSSPGWFCSLQKAYNPLLVRDRISIPMFCGMHGGCRSFPAILQGRLGPY